MNKYIRNLASRLIEPDLTSEFAACILDGEVFHHDVDEDIARLIGGSSHAVYVAWDKAGRPEYWQYLPLDSEDDFDIDPQVRHVNIDNALIMAISDMVVDALVDVVLERIQRDGWRVVACEKYDRQPGWFYDAGHHFELGVNSGYLVAPTKTSN